MLRVFITLFIVAATLSVGLAQRVALEDVLYFQQGEQKRGQIMELKYGEFVKMLGPGGKVETHDWKWIRRISYFEDKNTQPITVVVEDDKVAGQIDSDLPSISRKYYHEISIAGLFGSQAGSFVDGNERIIGVGASYYYLRSLGRFRAGAGADYALMHYDRSERTVAALATVSYDLLRGKQTRKIQMRLRANAGPTYPLLSEASGSEVTSRRIGMLVEPLFEVEWKAGLTAHHNVFVNFGYRILNANITLTTSTLDVLERQVNYRRVAVRGGYRF